ncbi:jeltraxin-like [Leptodactylus fuscus]|uniref:jeltraxin-like n=1 Tax=Leptodactylus fuscus TaxID=238119 RepID=UPI003F4EAA1C
MLFPNPTKTDYVTLRPKDKIFRQISVCLRSYTELTRKHSLFSMATHRWHNAFLIYPKPSKYICVSINNEDIYFKPGPDALEWKHICVTWDSETGLLQLWINGKRYPRRVTKTRSPIVPPISVILGQEQDRFGGSFDYYQSFVGELTDVNMWDYVVSPATIMAYFADYYTISGNVYSWTREKYSVTGPVSILRNQFYQK